MLHVVFLLFSMISKWYLLTMAEPTGFTPFMKVHQGSLPFLPELRFIFRVLSTWPAILTLVNRIKKQFPLVEQQAADMIEEFREAQDRELLRDWTRCQQLPVLPHLRAVERQVIKRCLYVVDCCACWQNCKFTLACQCICTVFFILCLSWMGWLTILQVSPVDICFVEFWKPSLQSFIWIHSNRSPGLPHTAISNNSSLKFTFLALSHSGGMHFYVKSISPES